MIRDLSSVIRVCQRLSSSSYQLIIRSQSVYLLTSAHLPKFCRRLVVSTIANLMTAPYSIISHLTDLGYYDWVEASLQTARLTFRALCVTVKLNKKNWAFYIWYNMTVDKSLTHILISALLLPALAYFCEKKIGIYFLYLCNSRIVHFCISTTTTTTV